MQTIPRWAEFWRDLVMLNDIGAGTGTWAALAARNTASVTAVERSQAMIGVIRENLNEA